jgi:ubiquitin-protein ligase E3 C
LCGPLNQLVFYYFLLFYYPEEEGTAMLSTREVRTLAILREIPFVFSFTDRVKMWQNWILNDKMQQQGEASFLRGPSIQVMIRRNYIYEDAFDKLSLENG